MMHAAMGLYADDVDETSRCSDRWRGQKRPWKIFSRQNNPAHDEKSLCSQKLIQINYARFYIIIEAYMEGDPLH